MNERSAFTCASVVFRSVAPGALPLQRSHISRPGRVSPHIKLYDYDASGNCYKARLLLALTGREYERVPVDIFAGDTLTPAYEALNPARETPVLVLDGGAVITQSNAIVWYLAEGTPFLPADPVRRAQALQWLLFELEQVGPGIASPRFWRLTGRGDETAIAARVARGKSALATLDRQLAASDFLVGSVSLADVAVYAYTHVAGDAGIDLDAYANVQRWFGRVEALDGFVDDFVPYHANAAAGAGRSIYD